MRKLIPRNLAILSRSFWVILVKLSYLATLLGSFLWKFDIPVGGKFNPADTLIGVKIHPADPHPYPFRGEVILIIIIYHTLFNLDGNDIKLPRTP